MSIYSNRYVIIWFACLSSIAQAIPLGHVAPSSVNFGQQTLNGGSAAPKLVTLSNTGNTTLTISNMKVSPEFSLGNPCFTEGIDCVVAPTLPCTSIEPGKGCTFNVWYLPRTKPGVSGSVRFFSNATGSPHAVRLVGFTEADTCSLETPPGPLAFPATAIDATSSATQTISVTNDTSTLKNLSIFASGDFLIQSSTATCGTTLAANQSCNIIVAFHPNVNGTRSGYVGFGNDDYCGTKGGRSLSGEGTGTNLSNPAAEGTPVNPADGSVNPPKDTTTDIKGCSMGKSGAFDPVLMLLAGIALLRLATKARVKSMKLKANEP
jgi:trimeric autotransporter adhesin